MGATFAGDAGEVLSGSEIAREFRRSKSGLVGGAMLLGLIIMTVYSAVAVPQEAYREWSNPSFWEDLPKSAAPVWAGAGGWAGLGQRAPEHIMMSSAAGDAAISESLDQGVRTVVHSYAVNFDYDSYPDDFMLPYSARYSVTPPALQIDAVRPDGKEFRIYFASLPPSQGGDGEFSSRVRSTDRLVSDSLRDHLGAFSYAQDPSRPQAMIFADSSIQDRVLKGQYTIRETFYLFEAGDSVTGTGLILGGKVYGALGTDEQRRDLATGILLGTPIALFIGLTVSTASVVIGLVYGVVAGYKGRRTDEGMMRLNDVFYALPVLPLLVVLSVTIGSSIFLITGFIMLFSWVGMAKVSRSMALQIKNLQYVEAAKLMGQSDIRIIFKHVIPQLLPLTFATIAISVPSAILVEATLSFLGLGDLSVPTWGRILHEANSASAAARGLWWWVVPPGLMIAVTGLAFALIGNALDNIVNPRARKR